VQTVHETLPQKETLHKKRAGGVAQGVGPEFKPQYRKTNKQKQTKKPSNFTHCFISIFGHILKDWFCNKNINMEKTNLWP
jgi:hypothetical protein